MLGDLVRLQQSELVNAKHYLDDQEIQEFKDLMNDGAEVMKVVGDVIQKCNIKGHEAAATAITKTPCDEKARLTMLLNKYPSMHSNIRQILELKASYRSQVKK